ncbi:MAG: AMP-binding protein [Planctomycetes bacterium]|nr:AMP-binding protein [Planctomycetota bacterium]
MSLLKNIDDFVVGWVTFPLTNHLMNRRRVMRKYRALLRSDRLSADALQALQLANLKHTLNHANQNCPFHAQRFREAGFDPQQIRSLDDLQQLPVLTRDVVTAHRQELLDLKYHGAIDAAEHSKRADGLPIPLARFRKHRLVRNGSSGSTGSPTIFYEDGSSTAMNWAHELRLKHWFGIHPGASEARFARVPSEYLPKSSVLRARWRLWHHLILPSMNLVDKDYEIAVAKLATHRPRVLFGVTSALLGMVDYLERKNLQQALSHVELIISWASPLYEHERKRLQKFFQAPVSNIYGSREVGHVACLCPEGRLHVNEENYLVEIEPSKLTPINGAGEGVNNAPGEILVTPLFQTPLPFIRYRIGDIGQWATSDCPCGRKQRVIENLLGRSGEVFRTDDGRVIAPNFWCRTFMRREACDSVERFQVVLRRDGGVRFRIVARPTYTSDTEATILAYLRQNLSSKTPLEFEYVQGIEPHPSGKYQMVVVESLEIQQSLQPAIA